MLTSAHSAPHRPVHAHTPPLSPARPLPLDALLGFSGTSGESSPEHSGPSMAACGSSASGRGSASAGRAHSPPLPQFPSFGDDLNFMQVRMHTCLQNKWCCAMDYGGVLTRLKGLLLM
jgi:hypothetical protein